MAKVFSAPSSIPLPQWSIKKTHQENMAEEKAYLDQLKDMLTKRKPTQKLVGEKFVFQQLMDMLNIWLLVRHL